MASLIYGGPTALRYSKYAAAPKAQPAVPSAVSSTQQAPTKNTIATQEQIAASNEESAFEVSHNAGAELAVTQGTALKEEVDKHTAKLSGKVASAVTSTRELLQLIREALKKDDAAALKTVDHLWTELEQLFEAANGAKDALPDFLEKQRNNMALYHGAMMNETYQETQQELNLQHKKVNVQHNVILEQQQAFQEYKTQTASKLAELEDLRERVSRQVLEKGNLKDEIDNYVKLLDKEKSTKVTDLKMADSLQEELKTLVGAKTELLAEVDRLQKIINNMQETAQTAQQTTTEQYTAELKIKADLLANETAKSTGLAAMINTLKGQESNAKMAADKLKAENKMLNEKYTNMAAEHSQAFMKSKEQTKKIDTLTAEADRLDNECAIQKERLSKLPDLEQTNDSLFKEKADLLEQLGKLNMALTQAKESYVKVNKELSTLTADLQTARAQNATLQSTVNTLNTNQSVPVVGGGSSRSGSGGRVTVLEQQVRDLTEQKKTLQEALDEWTKLAKLSYDRYKEILPAHQLAEEYRKDAEDKDDQIKALKLELASAKMAPKPNGVVPGSNAAYWKLKYEQLMDKVSN